MRLQNKEESIDEEIAKLQKKKQEMQMKQQQQPQQKPNYSQSNNPSKITLGDLDTIPKIGVITGITGFLFGGLALLLLLIFLLMG